LAFCNLLSLLVESEARTIADLDPTVLHSWFQRFDFLGSSDMHLSDGDSIVCFHGTQSPKQMYHARIQPPDNQDTYRSEAAKITFNDPRDTYRSAFIVSSSPFSGGQWMQMQPGQMLIIRRGSVAWDSAPNHYQPVKSVPLTAHQAQQKYPFMAQSQAEQAQSSSLVLNVRAMSKTPEGIPLGYRVFEIKHQTHYEYTEPVEHSTHTLRLQPTDDHIQEVVSSTLSISSPAEEIQYEDVFSNQVVHCLINQPYTKLTIVTTSKVKIFARPDDDHSLSRRQTSIPLVWMPWQRQMMMPYLLPAELPESQLTELTEYAMSFVKRNDSSLLKTIEDINQTIYRDYRYVSGSTSLATTPFDIYTSRQGVCQDFANLLICLARLLSIPARYRMGYIYTGADYANKIQSEASHAWAEVYLPYVGWRGFDPTNGCAVAQDHVRVACGRNYRDATPTSGTIYKGGGTETLTVDVKMRELFD
jgi:transglutaminase-like putative cysteine protease